MRPAIPERVEYGRSGRLTELHRHLVRSAASRFPRAATCLRIAGLRPRGSPESIPHTSAPGWKQIGQAAMFSGGSCRGRRPRDRGRQPAHPARRSGWARARSTRCSPRGFPCHKHLPSNDMDSMQSSSAPYEVPRRSHLPVAGRAACVSRLRANLPPSGPVGAVEDTQLRRPAPLRPDRSLCSRAARLPAPPRTAFVRLMARSRRPHLLRDSGLIHTRVPTGSEGTSGEAPSGVHDLSSVTGPAGQIPDSSGEG
jgi:hypothetical protein